MSSGAPGQNPNHSMWTKVVVTIASGLVLGATAWTANTMVDVRDNSMRIGIELRSLREIELKNLREQVMAQANTSTEIIRTREAAVLQRIVRLENITEKLAAWSHPPSRDEARMRKRR